MATGGNRPLHLDDPVLVGRRLREARRRARLTLRDLAFPGCSAAYISQIERGRRSPSLQVVVELARRLGLDSGYLARGVVAAGGERPLPGLYRAALRVARNPEEQVCVLAALAQAAVIAGDTAVALAALRRAVATLDAGEIKRSDAA